MQFVCIHTGILTDRDLKVVLREVWEARSKWYYIGLELGLSTGILDAIKTENRSEYQTCLTECLKWWIAHEVLPTWLVIIEALRSPLVGMNQLAEMIEMKYMTQGKHNIYKQGGSLYSLLIQLSSIT